MRNLTKRIERIEHLVPKTLRDLLPVIYVEDLSDEELDAADKALDRGRDIFPGYHLKSRDTKIEAYLEGMTDEEIDRELEIFSD